MQRRPILPTEYDAARSLQSAYASASRTGYGLGPVQQAMGGRPAMTWVLRAGREGVAGFYE